MPRGYNGVVTDPFRLRGTDGRLYFDILGVPHGLIATYERVVQAIDKCEANALAAFDPSVKAFWSGSALRLERAIVRFRNDIRRMGIETAAVAEARIRHHIKATQVRPDTTKAHHMEDNVVCRPLQPRPELGAVGIADIEILEKTKQSRGKPYWEAQEFGTDANVGRIVPGYFMPGRDRPSATQFRQHGEFLQSTGPGTPAMKIGKPIEERGFLRRGVEDAGRYRQRKLAVAQAKLVRELNLVAASGPPAPRALKTRRIP